MLSGTYPLQAIAATFDLQPERWRKCENCDETFTTKRAHTRHLGTHVHRRAMGEPIEDGHECGSCGKSFTRGSDLRRHEEKRKCHRATVPAKRPHSTSTEGAAEERPGQHKTWFGGSSVSVNEGSFTVGMMSAMKTIVEPDDQQEDANEAQDFVGDLPAQGYADEFFEDIQMEDLIDLPLPSGFADAMTAQEDDFALGDDSSGETKGSSQRILTFSHGSISSESSRKSMDSFGHPPNVYAVADIGPTPPEVRLQYRMRLNRSAGSCTICKKPYQRNPDDVRKHLESHDPAAHAVYPCDICEIAFASAKDLKHHQRFAEKKDGPSCGFRFPHKQDCTGHHPPEGIDDLLEWSDHIRFAMLLIDWENSQLSSERHRVEHRLPVSQPSRRSLPGLRKWLARTSKISLSTSERSWRSESHDTDAGLKLKMDEIARAMSVSNLGSGSVEDSVSQLKATPPVDAQKQKFLNEMLWNAVDSGKPEAYVQGLIEEGADPNATGADGSPSTACLITAMIKGHGHLIKALLSGGTVLEMSDELGLSPLHHAAIAGNAGCVQLLIERNTAVNSRDNENMTALHHATAHGQADVCRLLIQAGADVHLFDSSMQNVLHQAAGRGNTEIVGIFLEAGASCHIPDGKKRTALHVAVQNGNPQTVQALLDAGAQIDSSDIKGKRPLHYAAENGCEPVIQILVNAGASLRAKDSSQSTALDFAMDRRHQRAAKLLFDAWQLSGRPVG